MRNDFQCNDVECAYGVITGSCSVMGFNMGDCHIVAVDIFPKCGVCLEPSKDSLCLP